MGYQLHYSFEAPPISHFSALPSPVLVDLAGIVVMAPPAPAQGASTVLRIALFLAAMGAVVGLGAFVTRRRAAGSCGLGAPSRVPCRATHNPQPVQLVLRMGAQPHGAAARQRGWQRAAERAGRLPPHQWRGFAEPGLSLRLPSSSCLARRAAAALRRGLAPRGCAPAGKRRLSAGQVGPNLGRGGRISGRRAGHGPGAAPRRGGGPHAAQPASAPGWPVPPRCSRSPAGGDASRAGGVCSAAGGERPTSGRARRPRGRPADGGGRAL